MGDVVIVGHRAHGVPQVSAMGSEFAAVCDHLPLCDLAEAADLFATFAPLPEDRDA